MRRWGLIAPFAALHAALFAYDLAHPDRFLRADRADQRMQVIQGLAGAAEQGEAPAYLAAHGILGDWLPQALLYYAGGQSLVIAAQIVLGLASILWVRDIATALGLRESPARWAAALYGLLPHTLVFPHQLASEAIFSPLVVLAFRLGVPALGARAGLVFGLATLVRPVGLLWPFIQALVQGASLRRLAAFLALALAPLALWAGFVFVATGEPSMGRSSHDLGSNLYFRMRYMAAGLPPEDQPPHRARGETKATVGEYLVFVVQYPEKAAAHSARDLAVVFFKSGIERLTVDYLDLFERRSRLQSAEAGWRADVEQRGVLGALPDLLREQPRLMVSSALAAVGFAVVVGLALVGAATWMREAPAGIARRRLLLALFVLYVAATAQAVDRAQSRHRAPAEFALCVLAVAGCSALARRKEKQVRTRPTGLSPSGKA